MKKYTNAVFWLSLAAWQYSAFTYLIIAGTAAPGSALEEERKTTSDDSATSVVYNANVSLSIEQQRQKLPVFKVNVIAL